MDTNVIIIYEKLLIIYIKNDSLLGLSDYNDFHSFQNGH